MPLILYKYGGNDTALPTIKTQTNFSQITNKSKSKKKIKLYLPIIDSINVLFSIRRHIYLEKLCKSIDYLPVSSSFVLSTSDN